MPLLTVLWLIASSTTCFSGRGSARIFGIAGLRQIENTKRIKKRKAGFISSPSQRIYSAENAIVNEGLVAGTRYQVLKTLAADAIQRFLRARKSLRHRESGAIFLRCGQLVALLFKRGA